MPTHKILADLDVGGEVKGTSLDINGNADISGNLTGLDNVTSTNFIIGGHTINDVDITSEDSNADDHLMTSKAIVNLIADNENSFLTSVPNHSGNLITTGTVAAARVATLNQNTTGSSGSCTGNAATATTAALATQSTIVANNSTNETCYPVFVDGATGTQGLETDTGWTFNPSTGTLTTQKIATDVASIV